jgi:predicted ATPase
MGFRWLLELAAARAKVLAPAQILERLSTHPDLLKSREMGVPDRHKTLRAAIEWSVDLLSPELRQFFARGCVFRGGWTLEAAEAICAPGVCEEWEAIDFLEALRDNSLLLTEEGPGGTRYRLLETLREWGQSQLVGEEKESLQRRHFEFYLAMAESTLDFRALIGRQAEMEADNANFRAALGWAFEHEDPNQTARLVAALCGFWEIRSHFAEGCGWARRALERAEELEISIRARLLRGAGILFWYGGDLAQARDSSRRASSFTSTWTTRPGSRTRWICWASRRWCAASPKKAAPTERARLRSRGVAATSRGWRRLSSPNLGA